MPARLQLLLPPRPRSCSAIALALLLVLAPGSRAEPPEEAERIVIGSWNLEWFFDANQADNQSPLAKQQSAPSQQDWTWKRDAVADVIGTIAPTIMALQEVENREVLVELTRQIKKKYGLSYRYAFINGYDSYTEQDVGYIFRADLVRFSRQEQTREMYNSKTYYNLSKHLFARFQWGKGENTESLTLVNVHLRAGEKAQSLRERQCRLIRHWVDPLLARGENVVVLGDLNASHDCEQTQMDGDIGILCQDKLAGTGKVLLDLHMRLDPDQRATHLIGRQFDRILVSQSLLKDAAGSQDLVYHSIQCRQDLVVRGTRDTDHRDLFYKIPAAERDVSDHYPLVVQFELK